MPIENGDILRIATKTRLGSESRQTQIFHCRAELSAPMADADISDAIVEWMDDAYTETGDFLSEEVVPEGIDIYDLTQDRPLPARSFNSWPGGNGASEIMPAGAAAMCLFWVGAKKTIGKKFLSGVTVDACEGNSLTLLARLAFLGFAGKILAGKELPNDSKLTAGIWSAAKEIFLPYLSHKVSPLLAYQRRRKPGVGWS